MGVHSRAIPLSATSRWPTPNYINPERRAWFPEYGLILQGVATLIFATRLLSNFLRRGGLLGLDDAFIIIAWLFATFFTTLCVLGTLRYRFDRHIWDINPATLSDSVLTYWLSQGAFLISTCFTKISVLCFYRRLGTGSLPRKWKWTIWVAIGFIATYTLALLLLQILICHPTKAYWKSFDPTYSDTYHCSDRHVTNPLVGALGVFSDFYTILLTTILTWHVQMPRMDKIGLYVILALALSVVGAGITRSVELSQLADSQRADITWHGFDIFVSSQLECQLAIICACAPSLKMFVSGRFLAADGRPHQENRTHTNSMVSSWSGSTLPERFKRSVTLKRATSQRPLVISSPQALEIPDWATEAFRSPRYTNTPSDVEVYERYVAGKYGPPPPPKDHKDIFAQYRAAAIPSKDLFAQYQEDHV